MSSSYIRGYDLSSVQTSNIDFKAVAASGISFVIVKCYQGNDFLDPDYTHNIAAAKAARLYTLCYQFIYPLPTDPAHPNRDPIDQANLHWNASGGEIACIDCEFPAPQDFTKWGITPAFVRQWLATYLQEYERLSGRIPIIYSYPYWCETVQFTSDFNRYPYWAASYEVTPEIPLPFLDWVLWQQTGGGGLIKLLSGSSVPVDTNVAKDLSIWGVGSFAPITTSIPTSSPIASPDPIVAPVNPAPNPPSNIWTSIGNTISKLFTWNRK